MIRATKEEMQTFLLSVQEKFPNATIKRGSEGWISIDLGEVYEGVTGNYCDFTPDPTPPW